MEIFLIGLGIYLGIGVLVALVQIAMGERNLRSQLFAVFGWGPWLLMHTGELLLILLLFGN